jgi:hypothetical protein
MVRCVVAIAGNDVQEGNVGYENSRFVGDIHLLSKSLLPVGRSIETQRFVANVH